MGIYKFLSNWNSNKLGGFWGAVITVNLETCRDSIWHENVFHTPATCFFFPSQFVKFANIEEDTPSYHRSYDFFVSRFSEMCHSSYEDPDIRTKWVDRWPVVQEAELFSRFCN